MSVSASGGARTLGLVIGRELREAFRRKTVWFTAAAFLLASAALVILPDVLSGGSGGGDRQVVLIGSAPDGFDDIAVATATAAGFELAVFQVAGDAELLAAVDDDDDVDAGIRFDTDPPTVVVDDTGDDLLLTVLRQSISTATVLERLDALGLDDTQVASITAPAEPTVEIRDTERGDRQGVALLASITVYILLLLVTSTVANGVAVEKANRVSEVLLAIVPPGPLLFGKVIGVGLIGVFTLACGAVPIVVRLLLGGSVPPGTASTLAASSAFFLIGIALYLTLAGALGALVGRSEEVGAAVAPLSVVLIAGYLIGQIAAGTTLGLVLALLPLTSPVVMPARIALGDSSPLEFVVALVLGVAAVVVAVRVAGVVYRRAIVRSGERLHLRDVLGSDRSSR